MYYPDFEFDEVDAALLERDFLTFNIMRERPDITYNEAEKLATASIKGFNEQDRELEIALDA